MLTFAVAPDPSCNPHSYKSSNGTSLMLSTIQSSPVTFLLIIDIFQKLVFWFFFSFAYFLFVLASFFSALSFVTVSICREDELQSFHLPSTSTSVHRCIHINKKDISKLPRLLGTFLFFKSGRVWPFAIYFTFFIHFFRSPFFFKFQVSNTEGLFVKAI